MALFIACRVIRFNIYFTTVEPPKIYALSLAIGTSDHGIFTEDLRLCSFPEHFDKPHGKYTYLIDISFAILFI